MGFSLPSAMGVQAFPDSTVACVTGEAAFVDVCPRIIDLFAIRFADKSYKFKQ